MTATLLSDLLPSWPHLIRPILMELIQVLCNISVFFVIICPMNLNTSGTHFVWGKIWNVATKPLKSHKTVEVFNCSTNSTNQLTMPWINNALIWTGKHWDKEHNLAVKRQLAGLCHCLPRGWRHFGQMQYYFLGSNSLLFFVLPLQGLRVWTHAWNKFNQSLIGAACHRFHRLNL